MWEGKGDARLEVSGRLSDSHPRLRKSSAPCSHVGLLTTGRPGLSFWGTFLWGPAAGLLLCSSSSQARSKGLAWCRGQGQVAELWG